MNQPVPYLRLLTALLLGSIGVCAAARPAVGQYPQRQFVPGQFPQTQYPQGQSPSGQSFGGQSPSGQFAGNSSGPQYHTASAAGQVGGPTFPAAVDAGGMIPAADSAEPAAADGDGESSGTFSSILARLRSGGPLMVPLAICSLAVIALAIERLVVLRRGRVIPRPFVRRFTECVQDGQLSYEEALEICDEFQCPVAEVFHATVKRWGRPTVEVEQAVMDAGERIADGLRRYLRLFHAISNVAPLLGLLGTVLGMIRAFEALDPTAANAPPEMLGVGISEALITTAAGLSVAIPAYLAYIYFSARADRYLVEIDALCQQVVDSISAEGLQAGGTAGRAAGKRTKKAA